MKSFLRQIFALVPAILLSIIMPAQDIPTLPSDPSVTGGVLPNGMKYYLVANRSVKGQADFALVQNTGKGTVPGDSTSPVEIARDALASCFGSLPSSLQDYMMSHGAVPGRYGFVKVSDEATVFRFEGMEISSGAVLDSTLMVIMNLADRCNRKENEFLRDWYVSADQAVVISGDIDSRTVAEKLRLMSLMVPAGTSKARPQYEWKERPSASVIAVETPESSLSEVSATWYSRRTPREYMNTVQPEVFAMMMELLGDISCGRISDELERRGVPYAGVRYECADGDDSSSDNSFTVKVTVAKKDSREALEVLAGVMSSLDTEGASAAELRLSISRFRTGLVSASRNGLRTNGEYVDRCIAAFLNNSSLASAKERLDFHASRNIPDTTGVRLLNGIVSALLDKENNLELRLSGADGGMALKEVFDSSWTASSSAGHYRPSAPNMHDTLSFPGYGPKIKLKSVKKDHVSGGSLWTFSNGFKVVYRNMPSDGQVYYMLALNGGYGNVKGLSAGEGAFMSDFLDFSYVSGIRGKDFRDILMTEGITMDTKVHLSNLMISGNAPRSEMSFLMKALLALAGGCSPSEELFGYYAAKEELALEMMKDSRNARMTAIDSIMCPGYRFSGNKAPGKLSGAIVGRTAGYLADQMGKMNDGLLIIVGDIKEEVLKKVLLDYVGGFGTRDVATRSSAFRYQPISGWSTYTNKGAYNSIDVVMSARIPITAENYMSAAIAMMYLRDKLADELGDAGVRFDLSHVCKIYPEDRLNVVITVSEADLAGFAGLDGHKSPGEVLGIIRNSLTELSSETDESALAGYKARLKNEISVEMNDPLYWITAIALRHLDGKDLTTDYSARIDAVTVSKVAGLFSQLEAGSKVEYVITKE